MEIDKIPKAWDLMTTYPNSGCNEVEAAYDWDDIEDMMIKFAIIHLKAFANTNLTIEEYLKEYGPK